MTKHTARLESSPATVKRGAFPSGRRILQRKSIVGPVSDPLESEADEVANRVSAASHAVEPAAHIVQRRAARSSTRAAAGPESVNHALAGDGTPLDAALQADMGQRFGYDFSNVRVHSGSAAEESARDIGAAAYTLGQDIVFGAGEFAPATHEGRRLLAHELTHVVQQSDGRRGHQGVVQRQAKADSDDPGMAHFMRIYSFGPTGAGRMRTLTGAETIFSPAAPLDDKGRELVRAGTTAEPKLARFGRYFTIDDRHRPYPGTVPVCGVRAIVEWKPDDGSASSRVETTDGEMRYYRPGEPLGTKLDSEYIFPNDRPGVLTIVYVFTNPQSSFLTLAHAVHFVDDPAAPNGATVAPRPESGQGGGGSRVQDGRGAAVAPTQPSTPEKKPDASGRSHPAVSSRLPPADRARIDELSRAIKATSDAVKRDPLVRELRDLLSRLQPFIARKDAKEMIDDAITSLVNDGAEAGIRAILEAVTGLPGTTMPEDRNQTGPDVPQKDLGEQIFRGPKIPIKDAPAPVPSASFRYSNGPRASYEPGATITFSMSPPAFIDSLAGRKRVVIVAAADRDSRNPTRLAQTDVPAGSTAKIELKAPDTPGKYVIRVDIGLDFDRSSLRDFEVVAPRKK